jgi:hypothetical protein
MTKGAIGNLVSMGSNTLSKTLKKVKSNVKKIEAALPKDLLAKINNAVPKGTKVESINESSLQKDISSSDPLALAKKMNINTNVFSAFGK